MKPAPTLEEITEFCAENRLPASDAEYLFWKWDGNGFTNDGKPIKSWKGTIKSWQIAKYLPSQKPQFNGHAKSQEPRWTGNLNSASRYAKKPAPAGDGAPLGLPNLPPGTQAHA